MREEKKIIIDEDWKSQIASEREALEKEVEEQAARRQEEGASGSDSSGSDSSGSDSSGSDSSGSDSLGSDSLGAGNRGTQGAGGPQDAGMLPPASLEMLLTTLATEALMSMGQMPVPGSDQLQKNLPQAKYVIDLIEVLDEKTKGNLTDQEEQAMKAMLHQLRLAYVAASG